MAIQLLDQNTINQIAAGEVVERPASVVKELMENAIDAGATAITVEIREGGIGFIRITDNGCGIPKQELSLAFKRHSTSKIRSAEDLLTVSSLGFRGEALSSIAAVSQVELITKTADSLTGSRYQIEGGVEKGLEEVGAPDGTTFISRNLFFNVPARRKFLKTAQTEGSHVADLVEKIALSHPEISIRLIVNNQNKLHTSGNHNLKDIIYTIYGREITANLIPLKIEHEVVRVTGFIGKPVIARGNRNFENYFINGRYIKSALISKAIEDGYKSYMMQHKYPFTMLHFEVEPEYIDVNVHPSKMELRFKDGETMYRVIQQAITEALSGKELIPQVTLGNERKEEKAAVSEPVVKKEEPIVPVKKAETRAPEPFEVKRREVLGIAEPRAPYPEKPKTPVPSYVQSPNRPTVRPVTSYQSSENILKDKMIQKPKEEPRQETKPVPKQVAKQMEMFDNRLLSEKSRFRH
ncbi:MAG: DNA mismatch repair endonuclease MutL, partial [Lachnospiraceae bacterium]|nr:DNA mismatch repair endonuclease MutL [Lachnospiraceae bacterium]